MQELLTAGAGFESEAETRTTGRRLRVQGETSGSPSGEKNELNIGGDFPAIIGKIFLGSKEFLTVAAGFGVPLFGKKNLFPVLFRFLHYKNT